MRLTDVEDWIDAQLRVREPRAAYAAGQARLFDKKHGKPSVSASGKASFRDSAFTENNGLPVHRWVPWIAGFSASFVEDVLDHFLPIPAGAAATVLDPFSGVGTTLVTAMLRGYNVVGFEINPYAALACELKLSVDGIPAGELEAAIAEFEETVPLRIRNGEEPQSVPPRGFVTRSEFLSPQVEAKVLLVHDFIGSLTNATVRKCFQLALVSELVGFSNYSYEPSLGRRVSAGKPPVDDAPVATVVARKLRVMLADVRTAQKTLGEMQARPEVRFQQGDFFSGERQLPHAGIDLVITSPPYLNNYHYVRNSRPQVYWLGFAEQPADLKPLETHSFGKYWQTVRADQPIGLDFQMPALDEALQALRARNVDKGQYGGQGWANYAATYFNDSFRLAKCLHRLLRPGGHAVVVLGNSILQGIEFQTDVIFAEICRACGLDIEEIQMLRKKRTGNSIIQSSVRVGEASKKTTLYESAVIVGKPGAA